MYSVTRTTIKGHKGGAYCGQLEELNLNMYEGLVNRYILSDGMEMYCIHAMLTIKQNSTTDFCYTKLNKDKNRGVISLN